MGYKDALTISQEGRCGQVQDVYEEGHLTCARQESAVLRTYTDTHGAGLSYRAELQASSGNLKGGVMKG